VEAAIHLLFRIRKVRPLDEEGTNEASNAFGNRQVKVECVWYHLPKTNPNQHSADDNIEHEAKSWWESNTTKQKASS
jgi:hypothetical protein